MRGHTAFSSTDVLLRAYCIVMKLLIALLLSIGIAAAQTPTATDTDGDGLPDTVEDKNGNGRMDPGETDLMNTDTDRGGEADGSEVLNNRDPFDKTDDFTYDLDGDGLINGIEAILGTDPSNPDTDGDGIGDAEDPFPLDARYKEDKDGDGIPDEYEEENNLSGEKRSDASEDSDNDGLSNLDEFIQGTDPLNEDTDNDGVTDGQEVEDGTDPMENPCLLYSESGKHFADLENHWAAANVHHLHNTKVLPLHARIIDGYDMDGIVNFLPDREITRYELLKIALMTSCIALLEEIPEDLPVFTDVPFRARPREPEDRMRKRQVIYTALEYGIVEGYEDGTFLPDAPVNRAEALKILLEATRLETLENPFQQRTFRDVPEDSWFERYVNMVVEYDIVEGYEDGTFRPEQHITRAEAAKIVLLMMVSNPHVNGYVVPLEY